MRKYKTSKTEQKINYNPKVRKFKKSYTSGITKKRKWQKNKGRSAFVLQGGGDDRQEREKRKKKYTRVHTPKGLGWGG